MIGLEAKGPPEALTTTWSPSREHPAEEQLLMGEGGLQLGHLHVAGLEPRRLGSDPDRGRVVDSRYIGLWHSVRWSIPVIHAGRARVFLGPVGRGEYHGDGAVGDGGQIVPSQRLAHVLFGEQGVDVPVPLHLRELVADGVMPGPERHLGHRPLVGDARRNDGPGLERGEGDRVHAEGREVYGSISIG